MPKPRYGASVAGGVIVTLLALGALGGWVAVKELYLSYHNGYIYEIIGFPQYSNLN